MAETTTVSIDNILEFKVRALQWANQFRIVCLLEGNASHNIPHTNPHWSLAIDATDHVEAGENAFEKLDYFLSNKQQKVFGFFSYDLKNQIEKLKSEKEDQLGFPDLYFFTPRYLLEINGSKLTVNRNYPETFDLIERINLFQPKATEQSREAVSFQQRTSKADYMANVESIRGQIIAGDFYELNYCDELYAEQAVINPVDIFLKVSGPAKAPFGAFFRYNDLYLLCTSPERFLKRDGDNLISQPIKGTRRASEDENVLDREKQSLRTDLKEQAENVMIVDLVRNDLAKSSVAGSVKVVELFGVYTFNGVHQMISTVTSNRRTDCGSVESIKNAFPMGSMTGAPKIEVMKNIEYYEKFKRGLYSGSVGYFEPDGNFDFNVVIRSIFYNAKNGYLSVRAGGAITYDSVPEKEWDELLLKTSNLLKALNGNINEQ